MVVHPLLARVQQLGQGGRVDLVAVLPARGTSHLQHEGLQRVPGGQLLPELSVGRAHGNLPGPARCHLLGRKAEGAVQTQQGRRPH